MEQQKLKFGFDIHGVLDDCPDIFRAMTIALYEAGHEIHILTGSHASDKIFKQLEDLGIKYHKFFSIADYHKENNTKMWYDGDKTPWIDKVDWDKTKGDYCRREGIHLHFDDTPSYETYFTTGFARVWTKNNRNGRGAKKSGEFITAANLNAAGFIFSEEDNTWYHNILIKDIPIFTYRPDNNELTDLHNTADIRPENMADIKKFIERSRTHNTGK